MTKRKEVIFVRSMPIIDTDIQEYKLIPRRGILASLRCGIAQHRSIECGAVGYVGDQNETESIEREIWNAFYNAIPLFDKKTFPKTRWCLDFLFVDPAGQLCSRHDFNGFLKSDTITMALCIDDETSIEFSIKSNPRKQTRISHINKLLSHRYWNSLIREKLSGELKRQIEQLPQKSKSKDSDVKSISSHDARIIRLREMLEYVTVERRE